MVVLHSAETIKWSKDLRKVTTRPFTSPAGPKVPIPPSALGTFLLFFTTALLEHIVEQTNRYAHECMGGEKYAHWNEVTTEELLAFFGFMILMGLVRLPALHDCTSPTTVSFRHQEHQAITNLEKSSQSSRHFWYNLKTHTTIEACQARFQSVGTSRHQWLCRCIWCVQWEESQCSWKRTGCQCCAFTNTVSLPSRFHHVYFDNFFSGIDLLIDLHRLGLYGCGTVAKWSAGKAISWIP